MTLRNTDPPAAPTDPGDPTDPRRRDDGLGWVTRAVFPDPRVRLAVSGRGAPAPGHGDAGAGYRQVARYAVVPSVRRARFLLPLVSPRVTAGSVLAYNALRPPKVRAARAVLGGLARLGLARAVPLPVLTVSVPSDVDTTDLLLTDHLAALLDPPGRLHAAIGVRPPDPNHKPTLQLFDEGGRPRGYAKIGWNDATRALVRAETAALRDLAAHPLPDLTVPRPLAATDWADLTVAVVEPLPPRTRRVDPAAPPATTAMLAVAGAGVRVAFGESVFAGRVLREAGVSGFSGVVRVVAALWERDGGTVLEFGGWHGDWVPWNLGRCGGRLVVWDWEHRGAGVPVGFDLVHQAFQCALTLERRPAGDAAVAAERAVEAHGGAFGLGAVERRLVVDAYLVELWLRTWRLAEGGGGWNGALHPALLEILGRRLGVR
jgi:hypothetical protein